MSPRVRMLGVAPLSIVYGGFEQQMLETVRALRNRGVDAALLDVHDRAANYDVLHLFGPPLEATAWVGKMGARRLVVSTLTGMAVHSSLKQTIKRSAAAAARTVRQQTTHDLLRHVFTTANAVVCLNEHERMYIRRTFALPGNRVAVVPNGVGPAFRCATEHLFTKTYALQDFVLFVGTITKRKNPLRLVDACAEAGLPLVLIGPASADEQRYAGQVQRAVDSLPNSLWIGGLDHDDPLLSSAYAAAGVFAQPSAEETQSLAALEALAVGTPVVVGDRPYARYPPFNDCLRVNPDSTTGIAAGLRKALGTKPAPLPAEYDWSGVADALAAIYVDVLTAEA